MVVEKIHEDAYRYVKGVVHYTRNIEIENLKLDEGTYYILIEAYW